MAAWAYTRPWLWEHAFTTWSFSFFSRIIGTLRLLGLSSNFLFQWLFHYSHITMSPLYCTSYFVKSNGDDDSYRVFVTRRFLTPTGVVRSAWDGATVSGRCLLSWTVRFSTENKQTMKLASICILPPRPNVEHGRLYPFHPAHFYLRYCHVTSSFCHLIAKFL